MCKKEPIIRDVGRSSILLLHVLGHTVINSSPSVCKAFLISERRFFARGDTCGLFPLPAISAIQKKTTCLAFYVQIELRWN